jgi:shikimate dehydrogenase
MKINGRTRITGIFGYPVDHTLSPAMQNAAFEALGLDYCYIPFPVHPDNLADAVRSIRALNIVGINITVPHKEKVMPLLDTIDKEALFIGAVNTIVNSEGRLVGYNTDGRGFMQSLDEQGISIQDTEILVVGAGGAARAVSYYLCKKARKVFLYGRTKMKVDKLAADLKQIQNNISTVCNTFNIGEYDIIINATPLGLKEEDPLPFDTKQLRPEQVVCDLIYKQTRLFKEASEKGCITLNGLSMLLYQGALAFELWTGKAPQIEVMRNALMQSFL